MFIVTSLLFFALDRVSKWIADAQLALGQHLVLWPGVLELRLTYNDGMALGILSGNMIAIIILPIMTVLAGWFIMWRYQSTSYTRIATAMVVGGFLGNMADRLLYGYVLDMVYFPWMPWYICNVADIAICIGVVLLAFSLLFRPKDWIAKTKENRHEPHHSGR